MRDAVRESVVANLVARAGDEVESDLLGMGAVGVVVVGVGPNVLIFGRRAGGVIGRLNLRKAVLPLSEGAGTGGRLGRLLLIAEPFPNRFVRCLEHLAAAGMG